jgi:hypothetical protein
VEYLKIMLKIPWLSKSDYKIPTSSIFLAVNGGGGYIKELKKVL